MEHRIISFSIKIVVLIILSIVIYFLAGFSFAKNESDVFYREEEDVKDYFFSEKDEREIDKEINIVFVGDVMLSRAIGRIMEKKNNWKFPFLHVADFLRNADLTVANLESPISERGVKVGSIYSFRADTRVVEGLVYSGIDVVSLANNHIFDYGRDALFDTMKIVQSKNIAYVGAGKNYEEAHTSVIKEVKGTKIAFLAYTDLLPSFLGRASSSPAVAFPKKEEMKRDIQKAKQNADIVVVSFHSGEEYKMIHNQKQEEMYRYVIDNGADLVIGHHPHVVEDIEEYKNKYIVYSLGNFVFDQNFSEETSKGLLVNVVIKNKKIHRLDKHVVTFNREYQPSLLNTKKEE